MAKQKLHTRESLDEIIKLYNKALKIQEAKKSSWEAKYDIIFSDEISGKVIDYLDYYDPDGSEEEDIDAFMVAFERYIDAQEEILEEESEEEAK